MIDRPWLASYPEGVAADITALPYRSLAHLVEAACRKYAGRAAYSNFGRELTFAELDRLSIAFGAWLQSRGLARGARVAIMMPNVLQYPVCLFGALRAGMIVVNCNPLYTSRELAHQLVDSGAEAIVILENFAAVLEPVLAQTRIRHIVVASIGDHLGAKGTVINFTLRYVKKRVPRFSLPGAIRYRAALAEGANTRFTPVEVDAEDIAFLQYTGGTTGVSKGAMLLHRNVLANLAQNDLWTRPFLAANDRHVIITALPLYHIFSLTANCMNYMHKGGLNVLITNPRDMRGFVKELARHQFTVMTGVNTLFNGLLNEPGFDLLDFSALKVTLGGGMAVQQAIAERWKRVTGCALLEGYGLTETAPGACANPLSNKEFSGAIGLPFPSTEMVIRDAEGRNLPPGERGEICIRGPQVMKGYWQRPEETAQVIGPDGFFATGDIGVMDERGYFRIVDRKKDMINVSGFNVYPNEIEAVVAMHPGVLECAAIGVPDEHSGEAVKLFVVKRDPALTPAELLSHCAKELTNYKRPKIIEFRDELPKTMVGKILRRALRETVSGTK